MYIFTKQFYDIFDEVNGVNDTRVENNLDEEAYEHYDNDVKNLTYEDWKLGHYDRNRYESKLSGHVIRAGVKDNTTNIRLVKKVSS